MSLETAVRDVQNFESLIELLAVELKWDVEVGAIEDLTFEWTSGDLKINEPTAKKLQDGSVFQLRPPATIKNPPWGIFFVRFANEKIYRGVLRQVLRALVPKQRRQTELRAWQHENLLFICATKDFEEFTFAHFKGMKAERAVLSTFGWTRGDTHIRTLVEFNMKALSWPDDEANTELWLKKWSSAFDVERITERFFNSYREAFEEVEREVSKTILNHEQARLYTQRLFNRLMFVYFIQKKGWLTYEDDHNYLRAIFNAAERDQESFLRNRLHWLFFYGLGNAGLILDPQLQHFITSRIGKVPFLNGGLFDIEDSHDAQLSYEKKLQAADVEISNKAFGKILDLFERYNFTIEESTPLDVQVAVDPEMLGKVFEELVTGRHETGSYYTPRPVVAFMCREALKHYLGRVQSNQKAIDLFVEEGDTRQLTDPEAILDALKQARVCDLACGSGAYLLGMLQELMRLRNALFKEYQIDYDKLYDRKREIIEKNLYGVDKDKFAVQIACLRLWLSLAIDSETPQPLPNLDFKIGCDDSLTAPPPHETQPDMFRIEKVRQYREKKAQFLNCDDPDRKRKLRDEILTLREEIAFALNHQPPRPHPQRIKFVQDAAEQLRKEIRELVRANDKINAAVKQAQLKKLQRQLNSWQATDDDVTKNLGFDWAVEFAEVFTPQLSETWRIDGLHSFLNDFKHQPTLIESKAHETGFDIIVANPPYVRADAQFKHLNTRTERQGAILEWKSYRAALLKSGFYRTLYEKWDLYLPFLERAYQLLGSRGDMVFIISDAYNSAKYTIRSHEFFLRNSKIKRLDFCSEIPLFTAGINNTILHISHDDPEASAPVRVRRWGITSEEFETNIEVLPSGPQSELGEALFRFQQVDSVVEYLDTVSLGKICYISYGLRPNADDEHWRGEFRTEDVLSSVRDAKHPKRFLQGKNIDKWIVTETQYIEWGTTRAPAKFARPTFIEMYEVPEKLLAAKVSPLPKVAYDDNKHLHSDGICSIVPWHSLKGVVNRSISKTAKYRRQESGGDREKREQISIRFSVKYLLAILNSRFAVSWFQNRRRNKLQLYPDDWKDFPIRNASAKQQNVLANFVDKILQEFAKNNGELTTESKAKVETLENKLDEAVYSLYTVPKVFPKASKDIYNTSSQPS